VRLQYDKDLVHEAGVHSDLSFVVDIQPVNKLVPPFLIRELVPIKLPLRPVTITGDAAHVMLPCEYLEPKPKVCLLQSFDVVRG
jgi:hypothetical protein